MRWAALLGAAALACAGARPVPGSAAAVRRVDTAHGVQQEEIVALPTRPGVTQAFLLLSDPGQPPSVVALLFPGGSGLLGLPPDVSQLSLGSNFLVRTRERFRDAQTAVALLDAPSDQQASGMSDAFRASADHARDVSAVVNDLRRRFAGARVILVGTSRGTVSAAEVGARLGRDVDGVVLTSTVFEASRRNPGLAGFDFGAIAAPLLLVHHVDDACPICPYAAAAALTPRFPLVTVVGGAPPRSGPCDALSAHGYLGVERATVDAIKDWMHGRVAPSTVGSP